MTKEHLNVGLVQVYTGDGKGKTTAALGQSLRAIGRGLDVYMAQFIKGQETGELFAVAMLSPHLIIRQFGLGRFIIGRGPDDEELAMARHGWTELLEAMHSGQYDIIILDEISHAVHLELIELDHVLQAIKQRPRHIEMILTGRNMPAAILETADLITEMVAVKHPYDQGIQVRRGIEF